MRMTLPAEFVAAGWFLCAGAFADSVTLTWIASGDDRTVGTAAEYDLRYSKGMIYASRWDQAIRVQGVPKPKPAGSLESFTISGLDPGATYYFALKVADEAHNWSRSSNVVSNSICRTPCVGTRGNVDNDPFDRVNIRDVEYLQEYLFGNPLGPAPPCPLEGNVDGDAFGKINVGDLNYLLEYLFGIPSGPPPPPCPR